jgi:Protein of unknown function (DUF4244)
MSRSTSVQKSIFVIDVPTVGTDRLPRSVTEGDEMRAFLARMKKDDGLSTAEYAVGTVAAAGLGGVLIKLLTSDEVRDLIWTVVSSAFRSLLG